LETKLLKPYTPEGVEEEQPSGLLQPYEPETPEQGPTLLEPYTGEETPRQGETEETDYLGAIGRGVQTSLAPMTVDENEYKEKHSTGETVAEVASNIITDIASTVAVSAGAAAIAGSVVPGLGTAAGALVGTVAGVGLGIYRALGYEELMSRVEDREFSGKNALVNTSLEVIPALKMGGKVAKGLAQGTLGTLQSMQYGADLKTGLITGAIGGGLVAASTRSPKARREQATAIAAISSDVSTPPKVNDWFVEVMEEGDFSDQLLDRAKHYMGQKSKEIETFEKIGKEIDLFDLVSKPKEATIFAKSLTPEMVGVSEEGLHAARKYGEQVENISEEFVNQWAVRSKFETEIRDVARGVLDLPISAKIGPEQLAKASQKLKAQGLDFQKAYTGRQTKLTINQAVADINEEAIANGKLLREPTSTSTIVSKVIDPIFAARAIDRRTGGNMEGAINAISTGHNLHTFKSGVVVAKSAKLISRAKKLGIREDLADYLDGSKPAKALNEKQQKVVGEFRDMFDEMQKYAKSQGLDIDYRENYFPSMQLQGSDAIKALRQRKSFLGNAALADTDEGIEFRKVLSNASGEEVTNTASMNKAFAIMETTGKLKSASGFESGAAYQRMDKIPRWIQNRDAGQVFQTYVNKTTKVIHLNGAIGDLETQVQALAGLGYTKTADHFRRYINHVSGQPSEFGAYLNAKKTQMRVSMDKIIEDPQASKLMKSSAEMAKFLPDFGSWLGSQVYANYLGFSPKAVLRNLGQTQTTTATEIGGKYGHKKAIKASMELLQAKAKGIDLEAALQAKGYSPGKYIGEGLDVVHSSLRNSIIGKPVIGIEKLAETAMYFYGKSDVINRYSTMKISESVFGDIRTAIKKAGKELTKDESEAIRFFKELNTGTKQNLKRLMVAGKFEEAQHELTVNMLSKTQFNYGRHALHQFGQDYGRVVSMFTKWPSMIYADIADIIATKRYSVVITRYIAPMVLLASLDQALGDKKDDPRFRALVGKNFMSWAPANSLAVSVPPWISTAGEVIDTGFAALEGDLNTMDKWATKTNRIFEPYIPGATLLKNTAERAYNIGKNKKGLLK